MICDVDEKTYEFGMLRALGFKKTGVLLLILFEGIIFAIPGLCLGLLFAYFLNIIVAYFIFSSG